MSDATKIEMLEKTVKELMQRMSVLEKQNSKLRTVISRIQHTNKISEMKITEVQNAIGTIQNKTHFRY